jgi:hypothetical protein
MKMKITLIAPLSLFFLFFSDNLKAQQFNPGLTGGLLTSNIPGTDAGSHKAGFTGGLFVNTNVGNQLIVQMEMNYIQKGASQLPDSGNQHSFKYVFDYVEIPILVRHRLHFNTFKKPTTGFELEGGASIGRLFYYKYIYNNYNASLDPSTLNKTDVSLLFGINYHFTNNFYLCLRYSNSVIPVLKRDASAPLSQIFYTFNAGNNVDFQITLKYVFGSQDGAENIKE